MGKYNYMNLNQKMIKIRRKVPKLIRKRYSEDVTYDFVKLDDIYECLTPALNKYGVDFDILSERPTQMDEQVSVFSCFFFGFSGFTEASCFGISSFSVPRMSGSSIPDACMILNLFKK